MNETWWVQPDQLDEDQKAIVTLPIERSCLVMGPPGSGKTNLLLLRANYLVKAGHPNVRVLVFNRNLREFIASGAAQYAFSEEKISTMRQWQTQILNEHGKSVELPSDFTEARQVLLEATKAVVDSAGVGKLCDVLLLDESQDYWPEEIELVARLTNRIFAVGDLRQKIYGGESPIDILEDRTDETIILQFHYRNGLQICKLADKLSTAWVGYTPLADRANYDETATPSSVVSYELDDLEAQAAKIIESLDTQRKAYPDELLGVLVPRHKDLQQIWPLIEASHHGEVAFRQTATEGYGPFAADKRICVCTVHAAKGVEFRTVHLAACDALKKFPTQRRLAYTGITRTKTALSIYHSSALPGYLEDALASLRPLPNLPNIDEVF